jgi:hypothetical protein
MPAVPDDTERAYEAPVSPQNFSSKALQRGPVVIQPDFKHKTTCSISFSPIEGLLKGRKLFLIFKEGSSLENALNSWDDPSMTTEGFGVSSVGRNQSM